MDDHATTDYVVIGSGVAGLFTALKAAEHGRVLLVTKGRLQESNTAYAQGGIAAAVGPGDSPRHHLRDTLIAGGELCLDDAVTLLVEDGPARVQELISMGARFDTGPDGALALGREGAHSHDRILHARGDATGAEIAHVLGDHVRAHERITIRPNTLATDLIVDDGRCRGLWLRHEQGRIEAVLARAVVIATGGCGQVYRYTTNPWVTTGDGMAMAYRAGARLIDMEFVQFHPTALNREDDPMVLVSEAVRGEGAHLIDEQGRRFMSDVDARAELAPRDVVARAIFRRMEQGDRVYLDARPIGDRFPDRFPTIFRACSDRGLDPRRNPIPVTPAAHFIMGGIETDTAGRSSIPGLYACGEAACTGVHGANRLASNSLLEGLVFAERAAAVLIDEPPIGAASVPPVNGHAAFHSDAPAIELRETMWRSAGIVRAEGPLENAIQVIDHLLERLGTGTGELHNMLQVSRLIARAALARPESRGGHFRADYPAERPEWRGRRVAFEGDRLVIQADPGAAEEVSH